MQACSYLMSSWATDFPEKISVLGTGHHSCEGAAGEASPLPVQGGREGVWGKPPQAAEKPCVLELQKSYCLLVSRAVLKKRRTFLGGVGEGGSCYLQETAH